MMTPTNSLTRVAIGLGLLISAFFLSVLDVKAIAWDYEFTGYNKASQVQFGIYNDTTLDHASMISCTSSNDGYCAFENADLSSSEMSFNNMRFVIRGTDGTSFTAGSQYKFSFFFGSTTSDYYITQSSLSNTTGVTYQNFSNWTANDMSIISTNIVPIETKTYSSVSSTLYRVDVVAVVSSSTVSGIGIRLYRQAKTIYDSTPNYIDLFRYFSVTQMTPGSIDYTQDLNNINQSIGGLSDDISDSTQDIIDNQNANTDKQIESQKACTQYDIENTIKNKQVNNDGSISSSNTTNASNFIKVTKNDTLKLIYKSDSIVGRFCFYNSNKEKINCFYQNQISLGNIDIPNDTKFFRYTISKSENRPIYEICKNGNQAVTDTLTDDDVEGANSSASNFFSSFTTETYGLTSVITSPLTFIQSLTSKTCSPLVLPLPYVNRNLTLPCMTPIYQQNFGTFLTLYQTITFGIVSYWVIVRIFNLVKDFKNPDHDEIEVMDL